MRAPLAQFRTVPLAVAGRAAGLAVLGLALLAAGCGITTGAGTEESEIFRKLSVDAPDVAGGYVHLVLDYTQPYPVDVTITCALLEEDGETTVTDILSDSLPANPEGGLAGEATPVRGTIDETFRAPEEPGDYVVECTTPRDDNNVIGKKIRVRAAPQP